MFLFLIAIYFLLYIFMMTIIVHKDSDTFCFIYCTILCKIEVSSSFSNPQLLRNISFLRIYTYTMSLTYTLLSQTLIENL